MTVALSDMNYFFSIDSVDDIGNSPMSLSLDQLDWVSGTKADPPVGSDALEPPEPGFTRYWWSCEGGVDGDLELNYGTNIVHGKLVDSSSNLYWRWRVYVPLD